MALATRELELIIIAKDHTKATLARIGGAMAILGAGLTALGLKGIKELGSMTGEAIDFRQQIALAVTQADGLGATIENVGAIVNRVGTNINVPFDDLAGSLFDIFSTLTEDQLFSLAQAEELLTSFAQSAVAGQAPIEDIGRSTIAWLNALDQPATLENVTRLLDIQFELVRKGAGTYTEFAGEIGKVIPAMVGANQTWETAAGSLAFLTKNGLNTAMAATSAARAVELMFSPKAIKGLRNIGIAVEDNEGNFRQMHEIIRDLVPVFSELSDSARKIKFKEIFGTGRIQARRFFDLAIPNIAEFEELVQDMNLSTGEAAAAFEFMFSQPLSQMELFQNRWESIRRTIGDVFVVELETKLFPIFQRLWDWWQQLDPAMKDQIATWLAYAAAATVVAGAVLTAVGFLVLFLGLLKIFSGTTAIAGLAKLAVSLGWIGLVLAAIALAAFVIIKNWDKIWPFLILVWDRVTDAVRRFVKDNEKFFDEVLQKGREIWEKLVDLSEIIWQRLQELWEIVWGAILAFWERWGEDILETANRIWEDIKTVVLDALDIISGGLDFFIAIFEGDWEEAWEAVKGIAQDAWDIIKTNYDIWLASLELAGDIAWTEITEAVELAWNETKSFLSNLWDEIIADLTKFWSGIGEFFQGIWDDIVMSAEDTLAGRGGLLEFFQNLPGRIVGVMLPLNFLFAEWAFKAIGAMLQGFITGAVSLFIWLLGLPGRIVGLFGNFLFLLFNVGVGIIRGLWNGLVWMWQNGVLQWLLGLGGAITRAPGNLANLFWGLGWSILDGLFRGMLWFWFNLLVPWLRGIWQAITANIGDLGGVLWGAGWSVINGLWGGMKNAWEDIKRWLGSIPGWIRNLKGPLVKDMKLLIPEGRAIMTGLEKGLQVGFSNDVMPLLAKFTSRDISGALLSQGLTRPGPSITNTTNDQGQTFEFGDIISNADPQDIAAEIGWMVRMN